MASKYLLKYRTFESLMADVTDDLETYEAEGLIDPSKYIKVAKKVNAELGVDVQQEKEVILTVENYKANLPNDFYLLNFALLCTKRRVTIETPTQKTEEVEIPLCAPDPEPGPCGCSIVRTNGCCSRYKLVQKIKTETIEFEEVDLLNITTSSRKYCANGCKNLGYDSINNAQIKGDYIYTNFCDGTIYLNYMGIMEDEEGSLLTVDHPLINDYYEYAIKERVLENIVLNRDASVADQYKLAVARAREERTRALLLRNMPEFSEIQDAIHHNRKVAYNKYYKMFE